MSNRIEDLEPDVQPLARQWLSETQAKLPPGDMVKITITARTPAEQAAAVAAGASRATPGNSWHEKGRAWDFAIVRNGALVTDGADGSYGIAGECAVLLDLCWGGNWVHRKDWDHIESHPAALGCRDAALYHAPVVSPEDGTATA